MKDGPEVFHPIAVSRLDKNEIPSVNSACPVKYLSSEIRSRFHRDFEELEPALLNLFFCLSGACPVKPSFTFIRGAADLWASGVFNRGLPNEMLAQ